MIDINYTSIHSMWSMMFMPCHAMPCMMYVMYDVSQSMIVAIWYFNTYPILYVLIYMEIDVDDYKWWYQYDHGGEALTHFESARERRRKGWECAYAHIHTQYTQHVASASIIQHPSSSIRVHIFISHTSFIISPCSIPTHPIPIPPSLTLYVYGFRWNNTISPVRNDDWICSWTEPAGNLGCVCGWVER